MSCWQAIAYLVHRYQLAITRTCIESVVTALTALIGQGSCGEAAGVMLKVSNVTGGHFYGPAGTQGGGSSLGLYRVQLSNNHKKLPQWLPHSCQGSSAEQQGQSQKTAEKQYGLWLLEVPMCGQLGAAKE